MIYPPGLILPSRGAAGPRVLLPDDPINRGLRGWWPLNNATDKITPDISPFRNYAVQETGATLAETSPLGWVRRFSPGGATGRLRASGFTWLASSGITVSAWVKDASATVNTLFSLGPSSGTDYGKAFVPYLDGNIYWDYNGESSGRISTSYAAFTGKWTHVVLVNNGVNFKAIYCNGVLQTSGTTVASPPIATTGWQFGEWNGGYHNNTAVQNARVWGRALNQAEITRLYREPWAGTEIEAARLFYAFKGAGAGAGITGTISGTIPVTGSLAGTVYDPITGALTGDIPITGQILASSGELGGRLRRRGRYVVWRDAPVELQPVVSLAENYADDAAVTRAVDDAIARMERLRANASAAKRRQMVEDLSRAIVAAVERAAEADDEEAIIALL